MQQQTSLQRILGMPTTWLLGIGVAVGSGIFRTPGIVAGALEVPWLIALVWVIGGLVALMQGMVSAELATRFPKAGGEYVYLREAYGQFVAFFFGWAYTVFIIGGSAAVIGAAFGDFGCELLWPNDLAHSRSGALAAAAIVAVTIVNALGLRIGAGAQNVLTVLKLVALGAIIGVGFLVAPNPQSATAAMNGRIPANAPTPAGAITIGGFLLATLQVFWTYSGATDPVKMAEEVRDVRRAMPRALIGAALSLTVVYLLVNLALLRQISPVEMAKQDLVPGEMMARIFGSMGRKLMLGVAMLVCLAALSSAILATIRVTYALARDGLAFRFMSRMSAAQAPVPALLVVALFGITLVIMRNFEQIVGIYYFASAILFGLAYASLIVFRRREAMFPAHVYRCPFGPLQAVILIAIYLALAAYVAVSQPYDALGSVRLFGVLAVLYFIWKRRRPPRAERDES